MKTSERNFFSINVKSAKDFTDFLMMKGISEPTSLTRDQIIPFFIEYQQELMSDKTLLATAYGRRLAEIKTKGKRAKLIPDGVITLDRFQKREFLSLIAIAELMEHAMVVEDERLYMIYGKLLGTLAKEGANVYKALNLSLKYKDIFHVDIAPIIASQTQKDYSAKTKELANFSIECLSNAVAQSPYEYLFHSITNNYETLLTDRKDVAAMNAKNELLSQNNHNIDSAQEAIRLQQLALRASISMAGLDNDLNMRRGLLKTIITTSGYDPRFLKAVADDREQLIKTSEGKKILTDTASKMGLTIEDFISVQFTTDEIQIVCKEILSGVRSSNKGGSGQKAAAEDAPVQTHTLRPYI